MEKKGKEIVGKLLKKKIAKSSDGAVIMDLRKYKLGVWVLLRKDKTILYSGKDLALAEEKFGKFKLDESLYVVCSEQKLHFEQLFKTLELMGFSHESKMVHYGEVRLPSGKMSSRTGENVLYSDFLKKITEQAESQIKKRESKIAEKTLKERALKISVAAIKYSMLKQSPNKNIIFKPEDSLNFEGDTGPYILYSYARANSIIEKYKDKKDKKDFQLEELEITLIKKLSQFPEAVSESVKNLNPSVIAHYTYQLAQNFNEFYHSCPVIKSEKEQFRVSLVKSFIQVMKNSLNLLGIKAIEKM